MLAEQDFHPDTGRGVYTGDHCDQQEHLQGQNTAAGCFDHQYCHDDDNRHHSQSMSEQQ